MANYLDEQGLALYDSLLKQTIPDSQVQSNWNESDTTSKAYIQNKPTLVTPSTAIGNTIPAEFAIGADTAVSAQSATWASNVALANVQNADDLKAIEALSGTTGLLKKTAANTWTLDTTSLVTPSSSPAPSNYTKAYYADNADMAGVAMMMDLVGLQNADDLKAIEALSGTSGLLKKTAANTWTLDTSTYATTSQIPNVPIETISVNGTQQTISNKNVDISVPTHGQIAQGNNGYVTGGDVYSWAPSGMGYMEHLTTTTTSSTIPTGYSTNTLVFIKYRHVQSGSYETYRVNVAEGSWWVMKSGVYMGTANSSHSVEVGSSSGSGTSEFIVQALRVE